MLSLFGRLLPKTYTQIRSIMSNQASVKIGTHDGVFHCDEALACYLLKRLPQYKDGEIIRSRDTEKLNQCDIVVDVGSIYDPSKHRYDHHQSSFQLTLSSIFPKKDFGNVRLSSAGLVYAHFGHQIIADYLDWSKDDPKTDNVFDKVYENFIKEIDAIDNGVSQYDGEPRYHIKTNLSSRVEMLKPAWNEPSDDKIMYERFLQASKLTGEEFMDRVNYYGKIWLPARVVVLEAFKKRFEYEPNGKILVISQCVPWINHLFEIEKEHNVEGQVYFTVFFDKSWRVRGVPITQNSFELRRPLMKQWRGLRDEELSAVSKIDKCIFVHATGFIGGNHTMEGALKMALACCNDTLVTQV
ncbi:hypothetical protein BLOT_016211 [Blomia tropicalis]|nr:hypothetical protein BLOT_016211 [Blomia tropicalis]